MGLLRVSLANNVGEIRRVNAALLDFLGEEGAPPRVINRVRLSIEELVVNIVNYAYADDGAHRIDVEVRTEPGRVVIQVEDDGRAFDPNEVAPPALGTSALDRPKGGLGIFLVKRLSDEVTYVRHGGRNRVRVVVNYPPNQGA
jgi:serine/threonine-protein kinase RsbW